MSWDYGRTRAVVNATGAGRYAVSFAGRFGADWAANLCAALAVHEIDIRRGRAVRDADGYWVARFELEAPHPSFDLARLDWVELMRMPREPDTGAIRLSRYSFTEVPEHGGSIHLELVEQRDSVGLLAAVFSWLQSLDLVPVEFDLETHGEQVRDGFWLKAVEERRPRDEVCLALGRRLADFIAA